MYTLTGMVQVQSPEQAHDAAIISTRIQQFKTLWELWSDEMEPSEMVTFMMQEMACEILQMIREHLQKYNIHSGITVDLIESMGWFLEVLKAPMKL